MHRVRLRLVAWLFCLVLAIVCGLCGAVSRAHACDAAGQGAPTIILPITATQTGFSVPWRVSDGCPKVPPTMSIVWNRQTIGVESGLTFATNAGHVATNKTTLMPNTTYQGVTLCADFSAATVYCTAPFPVTTLPQPQPVASISITVQTVTLTSIAVTWNSGTNYDYYNVNLGNGNQAEAKGEAFTFGAPAYDIYPGSTYTVAVEGCFSATHLGSGPAGCSGVWTKKAVFVPLLPPQNVQAKVNASDIQVTWTNPAAGLSQPLTQCISRSPGWPAGTNNCGTFNDGIDDKATAAGTTYTYTPCLVYFTGTACASTTATTAPPPPQCKLTEGDCPAQGGTQSFTVTCAATVSFFLNGTFETTGTSFTGQEAGAHQYSGIAACVPNTTGCTEYQTSSTETCPIHPITPPTRPITNCRACTQTGRRCIAVPGGYQCQGNLN